MKRSGTADLPLHYGRVPRWLSERMTAMGTAVTEAVVSEFGRDEFLSRISDPFWFQSLGAVMGMDWHSSGITTSVIGALKRGINPISSELGLYVCGGRGRYSRKTPEELITVSDRFGIDGDSLVRASRLTAKVDNTCIQDGFGIYLHSFIVSADGGWSVIQQGMNDATATARRYHWHSARVQSFVSDPRDAIVGEYQGEIINLSDSRAEDARRSITDFAREPFDKQLGEIRRLTMPRSHEVRPEMVDEKRLGAVLALAHERDCSSFVDTLLLPGLGPRTLQALALVAEVIYGTPSRFDDPARFSFAHGGKDGHPFPVPLDVYDKSIAVLKQGVKKAKIGNGERLESLERLSRFARFIEEHLDPRADVRETIRKERRESHLYGGKTVFDDAVAPTQRSRPDAAPVGPAPENPEYPEEPEQFELFPR